jgi:hypothetical protein
MQKILCFVIAGLAGLVLAEGTVTYDKTVIGTPSKHTLAWTASTNGIVNLTNSAYTRGEIIRVTSLSSPTGSVYSITLKDAQGVDVLAGQGSGMASNVLTSVVPGIKITDGVTTSTIPIQVNDQLAVSVTGAGSNKTGTVILYVK